LLFTKKFIIIMLLTVVITYKLINMNIIFQFKNTRYRSSYQFKHEVCPISRKLAFAANYSFQVSQSDWVSAKKISYNFQSISCYVTCRMLLIIFYGNKFVLCCSGTTESEDIIIPTSHASINQENSLFNMCWNI